MFAQDPYSGYIHKAPEYAGYGYEGYAEPDYAGYGYYGEPAYDGFGNTFGYLGGRRRGRRRRAPEAMPPPAPPQAPPPAPPQAPPSAPPQAPPPADGGMPPEMGPEGGGEGMPGGEEKMGQVVYDGLGNPVGIIPGFGFNPFKAIGSAVRKVGSLAIGGIPLLLLGKIANRIRAQRRLIQSYQMSGRPVPPTVLQNLEGLLARHRSLRSGGSSGLGRTPWPRGWIRRPLPYTGLGPRRLYMRCAVWPGPRGLVPAHAAAMQAAAPAQPAPAMGGRRGGGRGGRRRR